MGASGDGGCASEKLLHGCALNVRCFGTAASCACGNAAGVERANGCGDGGFCGHRNIDADGYEHGLEWRTNLRSILVHSTGDVDGGRRRMPPVQICSGRCLFGVVNFPRT
jgi:hypothetical protein